MDRVWQLVDTVIGLLASVASDVDLRPWWRKELDREFEQQTREALAKRDAELARLRSRAVLEARVGAIEELAMEIKRAWPGDLFGSRTEALRTMIYGGAVKRRVSAIMDEETVYGGPESMRRLAKVHEAVSRYEDEARSVVSSTD